jgi:hypothetical protein
VQLAGRTLGFLHGARGWERDCGSGSGSRPTEIGDFPATFCGGHRTGAQHRCGCRSADEEGRKTRKRDGCVGGLRCVCVRPLPALLCRINTGWAGSLTRGPWAWAGPRRGFFVRTKSGKGLGDASDRGGGPWPSGLRDPRGRALGPSWPWARGCRPPSSRRRRAGEATTGCTGEGHKRLASELQLPADPVRLVRLAYQPPASDTFLS